ncbi:hypothetical protein SLEP1_g28727 [Rubroshorea leprosula]|uniref:Uncharacterized protein n=1 Tax=Rubroshorea leprosula TaxID=152421 RepID=A0AAV5K3Y7_9ROSI|nr:hypothetical protein SLEP1_g28727 [Rubroshorea leprosula]
MFPPIDHVEGGDENQPHNSAHNSASTANQDVVAAQLAAMQQQFAPQQNPEPVQDAPTLSESQSQSHIAPARQPLPDDVTRRLASLEKLVAKQRGAPFPHHAADSIPHPLNTNITLEPYPAGFKIPQLETYDGTKDPNDHLHAFYSCMQAQNTSDALIFNDTELEVSSFDQAVRIAAVILGLNHERFRDSLLKYPATTFSEVNDRSLKFITAEEYALSQKPTPSKNQNSDWRDENLSRKWMKTAQNRGPMLTATQRFGRPTQHLHNSLQVNLQLLGPLLTCRGVVTPHNDPLVISVMINNCQVQHVLVDTGSAPDIMYYHCFESLGLDPTLLQRYNGLIYGFNNQPVPVEGILTMNIAFGTNMPGIPTSVSQHKLSTNPLKKPVAQKRRLFGWERLKVIKEEVEKLLQADFVRWVNYCEWVANPMLVKKANGKWWMYIDYTNFNQAYPKDCYPMPNIDKLVEVASGNERLSLLDAYSSYHQVLMALEDEEKTSFYAGDEIYCYVIMPFGLKNAGATYQKMVTIVFRAQIGRNLEVYVDDIVVKSLKAEDHLTDLEETFNNLRKNRMRRGIEVNPKKIKAVAEMEPSKSVKDVQRLTWKVAALHRLISKSADKCLSFFKIMRLAVKKDESNKQKKFEWNLECQAAFDELKSYLSSPSLLTNANDGEILYLYLGISDEAISSVLVRDEGKQQKLVYYTSNVLHGAEIRYSIVEKAALAIKPECSGRLIKWAVELGEFEITFQQRSTIRAQAFADFIVECTSAHSDSQPGLDSWILYVDGASSNKGSGAGAILLGLDGYRSEHALKFNFDATNNMAEYEALLLGLELAIELKVAAVQIYSDSQLVVNQVNSVCEVVDPIMMNSKSVFVEIMDEPSFLKPKMMEISTDPSTPSWTDPIISFLQDGTVPMDKQEEMRLRKKASRYTLVNDVLYKRSFSLPLLCCLNPYEAEYALQKVHEDVCGSHIGARTLAHKVLRPGVGGVTHLIIGVDYFMKWVEVRPLSSLTSKKVEDFVFSSIICRYGISNQIVADNGT